MNFFNTILQVPTRTGLSAGTMQIVMILLLVLIFYFLIIRPQSKRQKELQKAREALKPGDRVITAGGIYGILRDINSTTRVVTIEVWEGVKLRVAMDQIYAVPQQEEKK